MKKYFFTIILFTQINGAEKNLINKALNEHDDKTSIVLLQKALVENPRSYKALFFLAINYCKYGFCQNSIACYKKLIARTPNNPQLFCNLGYALKIAGYMDQAIKSYKKAVALKPDYPQATFALALTYLQKGDFKNGWHYYQPYLKQNKLNAEKLRTWITNNELQGKRILLRKQGGLGDTMQFIRYAQKLKKMGAYVIVRVSKPMLKLLSYCPYIDKLISTKQNPPNYDDQTSLMALPAVFNSDETTIPNKVPYIFANPDLVQHWKSFFSTTGLRIGYCFVADLKNDESRLKIAHRSAPVELLKDLKKIENTHWYNLHKDSNDFGEDFDKTSGPFMDTAAIIENLDLIITVDTSIAHLAGALGKPVWLLLPFSADWRWIQNRTDSPWYPTMKIFKQQHPFDWLSVIKEIKNELQ